MNLADYNTPTEKNKVTVITGSKAFEKNEARVSVYIRCETGKAEIFLSDNEDASYSLNAKDVGITLPTLYIGPFTVKSTKAVVTEIFIYNHA